MSSTKITYTPKPIEIDIPEGYELAESDPRKVKLGDIALLWMDGEFDKPVRVHEVLSTPTTLHEHPLIGDKRFIVKKVFTPKFGDIIECSNNNGRTWYTRVFVRKSSVGFVVICNAESHKDIESGHSAVHSTGDDNKLSLVTFEQARKVGY